MKRTNKKLLNEFNIYVSAVPKVNIFKGFDMSMDQNIFN